MPKPSGVPSFRGTRARIIGGVAGGAGDEGDIAGMRAGVAKVFDAHAKVLGSVQEGEAAAETCVRPPILSCAQPKHASESAGAS